jgi:YfiH family protein
MLQRMKQSFVSVLAIGAVMICSISAWAAEWTDASGNVWTYYTHSQSLGITIVSNVSVTSSSVTIPSKIEGCDVTDIVSSHQTHTTNIRIVTSADKGKGVTEERDYTDIDGLITDERGLALACFYADCVPLFFVDPVRKAIGLSHSGWRGTVGRIGRETIQKMQEEYGSNPADIIAAIGPSICQDCYEVSEDVIEQFKAAFDEKYWSVLFYQKENGKYQLNLWKANEIVMLEVGILREHIAVTNVCTNCNSEELFSHRASKGQRGALAAFLALK